MGDGIMATFNSRGDQPDHAVRAAGGGAGPQRELTAIAEANPGWPRLRVGVNSGVASVREMGGHGFVDYVVVGDTINTASRLESEAPEGGVLIGAETRRALPDRSIVEAVPGLRVKGERNGGRRVSAARTRRLAANRLVGPREHRRGISRVLPAPRLKLHIWPERLPTTRISCVGSRT